MEFISTIEQKLTSWFAHAPHLPTGVRRWLASNIWWIILVIATFSLVGFSLLLLAALVGGALATLLGGVIGVVLGSVALGAALLFSLPTLIVAGLLIAAVSPLRARLAKGWRWLFLAVLLDMSFAFIQLAFSASERGLFTFIVTTVIALYVLFELRSSFVAKDTIAPAK